MGKLLLAGTLFLPLVGAAGAQSNIVSLQAALAGSRSECVAGAPLDALNTLVETAIGKRDGDRCILAYIEPWNDGGDAIGGLIVVDQVTGQVRRARLAFRYGEDVRQWPGEINHIEQAHGLILVGVRSAIDADSWTILDGALAERGRVYGLHPFVLQSGVVLYARGQPHFAPTHWLELAGYDPSTKASIDLFPKKPYSLVRMSFMQRTQATYDSPDFSCAERNHHCNGELFDSEIGEIAASVSAKAVAFTVRYGGSADDWPSPETVMATCDGFPDLDRVKCRETPIEPWRKAFPGVADSDLPKKAAEQPLLVRADAK